MLRRPKPEARPRSGTALVASAAPLKLDDAATRAQWRNRQAEWQAEAWGYFYSLGELGFAFMLVGNWARKLRLFAAVQPDLDQPPIPVDDPKSGVPAGIAAQANAAVDALLSDEGTHGALMSKILINLEIGGEVLVLGDVIEGSTQTQWKAFSTSELIPDTTGTGWMIRRGPNDRQGRRISDDAAAFRIWNEDPQWSELPYSNLRSVLDDCDSLLTLKRTKRSNGRARSNNGILLVPSEADLDAGSLDPTLTSDGEGGFSQFVDDLTTALMAPISNEGSAAAVAPIIVQAPSQYIEMFKHLTFDRPLDPSLADQRQEDIVAIASGLDLPAEVLLGLGQGHVNHWTSEVIDEQTFKGHVEPKVERGVGGLSKGYLAPALGPEAEPYRIFVWFDASALVSVAPSEETAIKVHEALAISDAALRARTGFTDEDAPDEGEAQARTDRKRALQPVLPNGQASPEQEAVAAPIKVASVQRPVLAAAPNRVATLGEQLAQVDHDLMVRVTDAASFTLNRSLELAGARLSSKAQRFPGLAAKIQGMDRAVVAAALGAKTFATLDVNADDLLDGAFASLEQRYQSLVRRAQERARALLARIDTEDDMDPEALTRDQDDHRALGWLAISAGLLALARERLFDPHPAAPLLGEFDATTSIPAGLVRESLSRAGGAAGRSTQGGAVLETDRIVAGGVATGPDVLAQLSKASIFVSGYTWETGDPDRPFEPHQALGGTFFTGWDDEALTNSDDFPDTDSFYPGDHAGCLCLAVPTLVQGGD